MSPDFCALWASFVADPTNPSLIEEMRKCYVSLLEHVEECDRCAEASASADPITLYDQLAAFDETPGAVDDTTVDTMLEAVAKDREAIEHAVTDVLLPSLPPQIASLATLGNDVSPRTLFLALDSVRMMLKRRLRSRVAAAVKTLAMRSDGTLVLNGEVFLPSEVLVAEVRQYAGLSVTSARNVLEWIPKAARSQPHVLPGVDAESEGRLDGVYLKMVPWDATGGDLFERWKVVPEERRVPAAEARPASRKPAGLVGARR
jgi:hypothetical protein